MNQSFRAKLLIDLTWLFSIIAGLAITEALQHFFHQSPAILSAGIAGLPRLAAGVGALDVGMLLIFVMTLMTFHISNVMYYRHFYEPEKSRPTGATVAYDYTAHFVEYLVLFWIAELFQTTAANPHVRPDAFFGLMIALFFLDFLWLVGLKTMNPPIFKKLGKRWTVHGIATIVAIIACWGSPHIFFPAHEKAVLPWFFGLALCVIAFSNVHDILETYRFYRDEQAAQLEAEAKPRKKKHASTLRPSSPH